MILLPFRLERAIAGGLVLMLTLPLAGRAELHSQSSSQAEAVPQQAPGPAPQQTQPPAAAALPAQKSEPQNIPSGTAAAPVIRSGGDPASAPAGAAIAPAKQRRSRSYALRVGLIVGAAVAIGVVAAASLSSSSRPH